MKHALEGLSYWLRDNWKAALLVVGLGGLFIALGLWATRSLDTPAVEEEGEVVRFGSYGDDRGPIPVVLVRMRDGRIVQLGVHRSQTHNCRVGSTIGLRRRGAIVTVARRGCQPPAP